MRRLTVLFFLLLVPPIYASEVLDNAAVVRMVAAGLGPDLIVLKIERSQGSFDTSTDGLIALKNAHVPDVVVRAMLLKDVAVPPAPAPAAPTKPMPAPAPASPEPVHASEEVCANVKFYSTGNDGPAWQRSNVCAGAAGLSVDEQTIALAGIVVYCTSKAPILAMGGSLLHGEQEWWISDAKETLKFRGTPEDLDRLAAALSHARGSIPHGGCNDREVRRRLVRP